MPGDYFWKFTGLRLMRGYQMVQPGKKLCFMGGEFGQFIEWDYRKELDWMLLDFEQHRKMQDYTRDLNRFYLENTPLWADDSNWNGYQWIQPDDGDNSIISFRRIDPTAKTELVVVLNMTPVTRENYHLGLPRKGEYVPVFCSDDLKYGGTGTCSQPVTAFEGQYREYKYKGLFKVPPMSLTIYECKNPEAEPEEVPVPAASEEA